MEFGKENGLWPVGGQAGPRGRLAALHTVGLASAPDGHMFGWSTGRCSLQILFRHPGSPAGSVHGHCHGHDRHGLPRPGSEPWTPSLLFSPPPPHPGLLRPLRPPCVARYFPGLSESLAVYFPLLEPPEFSEHTAGRLRHGEPAVCPGRPAPSPSAAVPG